MAVNTWHGYVCAYSLVPLDLLANAFGLAEFEGLALDRLVHALRIVLSHVLIVEDVKAAHLVVAALELHFLELLFDFFHVHEFGFLALQWARADFKHEFFKAFVMKSDFALAAFNRVNQNRVAEAAQVFLFELVLGDQILLVQTGQVLRL